MTIQVFSYLLLGLIAGIFSGIVGIGGGIIIIPALVFLFSFSQHEAQGTTLALMVLPIGILAAWSYYKQGYVDVKIAGLIASGFLFGGLIGSKIAFKLSDVVLSRLFGIIMLIVAIKLIFKK